MRCPQPLELPEQDHERPLHCIKSGVGTAWQASPHRVPVLSDGLQADGLADVDQVQDVLLEAGPAEAHAGVQELGADARVRADAARHLCPST